MNEPLQTYYIPFLIIASVIAICGAVIYAYIVNRKLSKTIDSPIALPTPRTIVVAIPLFALSTDTRK